MGAGESHRHKVKKMHGIKVLLLEGGGGGGAQGSRSGGQRVFLGSGISLKSGVGFRI